jgi:hypothetical protein
VENILIPVNTVVEGVMLSALKEIAVADNIARKAGIRQIPWQENTNIMF